MPRATAPEVRLEDPNALTPPPRELRTAEALVRGTVSVFNELEEHLRPNGTPEIIEAFDAFLRCRNVLLGRLADAIDATAPQERGYQRCPVCRRTIAVGDRYELMESGDLQHTECVQAPLVAEASAS